jgi:CheY-like chemotaxis protein
MAATDRAARQVERLLAFARRQRLEPQVVDINALVAGMTDLLEYSLGGGISLGTALAPGLPPVRVDPGQLENALMNLAINARDAIAGTGRIELATARVEDGAVEIAVADTGAGMAPELLERVIEPFFTTKAQGKGSGLGLSMVYGFVCQSGGTLTIESTPGAGTRVRIRLPALNGESPGGETATADPAAGTPDSTPTGAGETVLAVDDDPELLRLAVDQLAALGYRALAAGDGESALETLGRAPEVRALYTDLAMPPPWDGPSLAREALARHPGLALLYTSAEDLDPLDPPAELLLKPVPIDRLARALRRILAG